MKNYFEYRGYLGSAEVDAETGALVGRLLYIRDTITYSAVSVAALKKAFEDAVNEYLETCEELGDAPDTPCKGTFNVRVGPDVHRRLAIAARRDDISLNEYVRLALDAALSSCQTVKHVHTHQLIVSSGEPTHGVVVATDVASAGWLSSQSLETLRGKQSN